MNKQNSYVIAVDIGTTSVKTLVIHRSGDVLAIHSVGYPLHVPQPDMAEQDPDEIFEAVIDGVKAVIDKAGIRADEILCLSFSSAMHSLIVLDDQHQPLTQSMIWADQRSVYEAKELMENGQGHQIYLSTGTPIHPMSPLTKLLWLRTHRPDLYKAAHKYVGIKEYIFMRLFGEYVIDYSIASATGMFNIHKLEWDEDALHLTGVTKEQLSVPVSTTYTLKGMKQEYAARMGISAETPFVIGASDGVLANLGIGVMDSSEAVVTIGTSSAVRTVVRKSTLDPEGKLFCYALTEDNWVIGGASNNGGIVLRWVVEQMLAGDQSKDQAPSGDPYDGLLEMAGKVAPGAEGLLFLPMLTGERAPFWDASSKGVYFGLSISHSKQHMVRAAVEGVIFQIGAIVSLIKRMSEPPHKIRICGGVARSALICQITADVLGIPVEVPEVIESSGLGAAMLGLYALGESDTLEGSFKLSENSTRYEPNEHNHELYQQLLPIYLNVYNQLKGSFAQIAKFQKSDASNIRGITT